MADKPAYSDGERLRPDFQFLSTVAESLHLLLRASEKVGRCSEKEDLHDSPECRRRCRVPFLTNHNNRVKWGQQKDILHKYRRGQLISTRCSRYRWIWRSAYNPPPANLKQKSWNHWEKRQMSSYASGDAAPSGRMEKGRRERRGIQLSMEKKPRVRQTVWGGGGGKVPKNNWGGGISGERKLPDERGAEITWHCGGAGGRLYTNCWTCLNRAGRTGRSIQSDTLHSVTLIFYRKLLSHRDHLKRVRREIWSANRSESIILGMCAAPLWPYWSIFKMGHDCQILVVHLRIFTFSWPPDSTYNAAKH